MINKMPFFAQCLEDGGTAQVYVRRLPGLDIPAEVETPAMLEYGWNLPIPIPDLRWDLEGIRATLSFSQTPYKTRVPWEAIVAIAPKGQGCIVAWDQYVPAVVQDAVPLVAPFNVPETTEKKARHLSVVRENT